MKFAQAKHFNFFRFSGIIRYFILNSERTQFYLKLEYQEPNRSALNTYKKTFSSNEG